MRRIESGRTLVAGRIAGADAPPTRTRSGRTRCAALEVGPGERPTVEVDRATLWLRRGVDEEVLHGLRLAAAGRPGVVDGSCSQPFAVTGRSARGLETSLGSIFEDEASCRAAPSSFTETCRGEECSFDEAAARPFELGACEPELARLEGLLGLVTESTHDQSERTLRRVRAARPRGLRLWERTDDQCVAVTLQDADDGLTLRSRYVRRDGARIDSAVLVRFEPLFHRAILLRNTTSFTYPNGGVGAEGSAPGRPLGVVFGDGVMLFDGRPMFLSRARCAADSSR